MSKAYNAYFEYNSIGKIFDMYYSYRCEPLQ